MLSPLIIILSLSTLAWHVSSQANVYEYSEQRPWTFVYTLYPYYNSETLLEVWKTDKGVDGSTNLATVSPNEQGKSALYASNVNRYNETNLHAQSDAHYIANEPGNTNTDLVSKSRLVTNYRNRRKDSNLQNE